MHDYRLQAKCSGKGTEASHSDDDPCLRETNSRSDCDEVHDYCLRAECGRKGTEAGRPDGGEDDHDEWRNCNVKAAYPAAGEEAKSERGCEAAAGRGSEDADFLGGMQAAPSGREPHGGRTKTTSDLRWERELCCETSEREKSERNWSRFASWDAFVELCCGTASMSLFHLMRPRTVGIAIDRDRSAKWVLSHIPEKFHERLHVIREDVARMSVRRIDRVLKERFGSGIERVCHVHDSHPCKTYSQNDCQKRHRSRDGRPLTDEASRDDAVLETTVDLFIELVKAIPKLCVTFENPVSPHILRNAAIRRLLGRPGWRAHMVSYCKAADPDDGGPWARKHTIVITYNTEPDLRLPVCRADCNHLVPGTRRHICVLAGRRGLHPAQVVERDVVEKGRIPSGVFRRVWESHLRHIRDRRGECDADTTCNAAGKAASKKEAARKPAAEKEASTEKHGIRTRVRKPIHTSASVHGIGHLPAERMQLSMSVGTARVRGADGIVRTGEDIRVEDCEPPRKCRACTIVKMTKAAVRRHNTKAMARAREKEARDGDSALVLTRSQVRLLEGSEPGPRPESGDTSESTSSSGEDSASESIELDDDNESDSSASMSGSSESSEENPTGNGGGFNGQPLARVYDVRRSGGLTPWAAGWPGLRSDGLRFGDLNPWQVFGVDEIGIAAPGRGGRKRMLFAVDYVTNGYRIRHEASKTEHGEALHSIITEEGLQHRGYPVTCISDGCGSMKHVEAACEERDLRHMYSPPFCYQLNPAEAAVRHFKEGVNVMMLAAVVPGGGIAQRDVTHAADYFCWLHERIAPSTRSEYCPDDVVGSPLRLNTGADGDLALAVPFGTPGYAFVPEEVRESRTGAKQYRAEPVLCLGFRSMYSTVYRCRTTRGSDIFVEQVEWDLDAPLGIFPKVRPDDESRDVPIDDRVFNDAFLDKKLRLVSELYGSAEEQRAVMERPTSAGARLRNVGRRRIPDWHVLRPNFEKIYRPDGTIRCERYIRDRVEAVNGLTLAEAIKETFMNKHGKPMLYAARHIAYDVQYGWLNVETCEAPAEAKVLHEQINELRRSVAGEGGEARACGSGSLAEAEKEGTAFMAMRDLPWEPYLRGDERQAILDAFEREEKGLTRALLRELFPGDAEYDTALRKATRGRALLEYKRKGVWKVRWIVQGFREDKIALDGADFMYSSNVAGLTAIRNALLAPASDLNPKSGAEQGDVSQDEVILSIDIAQAYTQSDFFGEHEPKRYLVIKDPVTKRMRYFRQFGPLYGSASSSVRWENTLHPWLVSVGFEQGKNEPCVFWHRERKLLVVSYSDDLLCRGRQEEADWFVTKVGGKVFPKASIGDTVRLNEGKIEYHGDKWGVEWVSGKSSDLTGEFKIAVTDDETGIIGLTNGASFINQSGRFICKEPTRLAIGSPIDHLGMAVFLKSDGIYVSMQCYIETMLERLDMTGCSVHGCRTPINKPILDMTELNAEERKFFMSGCGMIGWLALTARPDVKFAHSRISQHMASPNRGALEAVVHCVRYLARTRHFCLHQLYGEEDLWSFSSDSDQSGNVEIVNKSRNQLGHLGMRGRAPIIFGSKACSTKFEVARSNWDALLNPTCHPKMKELHADVSSAAAEIYAASVALSEILYLSYITEEMGMKFELPITLLIDNSTCIAFSRNTVKRSKLRHIDCRMDWVKALRDEKLVRLEKVDTKENISDVFTKILDAAVFEKFRDRMLVECRIP